LKHPFEIEGIDEIDTKEGKITLPCMHPVIVPLDKVQANDYNPNHVSDNNMQLLLQSVKDNGFCFPVVTIYDDILEKYIVIDGFHRYLIFKEYLQADVLPVVVLNEDISQRMASTVQFNRARGVHQVDLMGDLVQKLVESGASDEDISQHLGMDMEEVYRLKQITGIAEIFKNANHSKAWHMEEVPDDA